MIGALLLLVVIVVPADEEFTCTPTRVWDGDGPVWYFIPSATDCPLKRVISAALAHAKAPPSLTAPAK